MCGSSLRGNREVSGLTCGRIPQARIGRTKWSDPLRSRWSQGRGPRGTRASKARAGHRTGKACHRRWNAYGGPHGKCALVRQRHLR
jgi:hypothetical protein